MKQDTGVAKTVREPLPSPHNDPAVSNFMEAAKQMVDWGLDRLPRAGMFSPLGAISEFSSSSYVHMYIFSSEHLATKLRLPIC